MLFVYNILYNYFFFLDLFFIFLIHLIYSMKSSFKRNEALKQLNKDEIYKAYFGLPELDDILFQNFIFFNYSNSFL